MQKPKIFGYILRLWHMVPKIHGTAVSIKTRKTKKSARTNSKVKPSNQVRIQQMNIEFKQQNKDRSTSYIYSHSSSSSSSSRSFSTSDDDDDDDDDHHHHHPYFPPHMDHRVYDNLYAPRIVDYYDDDEPNVPPLMKRNEVDAPYIRPLSDYGDQIFHTSDDDDDDDDDDDPYFTPRTHHEDFEDLYVPPLMKHNDAGDPYIRRPLVDYRDNNFQISNDQNYAEQLQLEELVFSSASHASTSSRSKPPIVSSKLPERYCNICTDTKTESEMFRNTNVCGHMYCFDCIREHIAVKIKENMANVTCPDPSCKGLITPEVCRFIVPTEVLIRWENALCESMILGSQKFYCPFKDCSALLVDDGRQRVTSAECPHCNRLFCAQCKVAWHAGMDCREFKMVRNGEIDRTDILMMNLVKNKKWMKCPSCSFYVEKTEGCNHITCSCRYEFCYACGMKYHKGPCQPAKMIPPARMVRPARMIL